LFRPNRHVVGVGDISLGIGESKFHGFDL